MQLESLKIFCDVIRWASFSRGAAENGISQSSASQAVQHLEGRLGVKLIDRSKRPLVPTIHGKVYYEGCKDLVGRYQEIEDRVKALEDEQNVVGTLRVASIYSVGLAQLTRHVERFRLRHPGADVRLECLHPTRVIESVASGDSELGLISFPKRWPDLVAVPWYDEEMVLAVAPEHPFAGTGEIEIGDLDGEKFVHFDAELSIRRAIDKFLRKHAVSVSSMLEFDNIENIKRAVEIGAGVAILPAPSLDREVTNGSLVVVRFRDHRLVRPLAILHRDAGGLSPTATRFLKMIREPQAADSRPMALGKRG